MPRERASVGVRFRYGAPSSTGAPYPLRMASGYRSVRLDGAALDRVLHSPYGEVGVYMARVGGYVTRECKSLADTRLRPRQGPRQQGDAKRYRDSFKTTTRREGAELRTTVTNSAAHATYLENGTRPHEIVPRRAKALVFVVAGNGKRGGVVFAQKVHHPGTKPYRIMQDGLRRGIAQSR